MGTGAEADAAPHFPFGTAPFLPAIILRMGTAAATQQLLHDAVVTRQTDYGAGYYVMELECPELAQTIDSGQFVNLRCRNEWTPLLRRPFSVFDVLTDASGKATGITLLYHTVGAGTRLMAKAQKGDILSLNGPLGKPFQPPANPDAAVIMVGGGIGIAPFLLQSRRFMQREPKREYGFIAGGRSERDLRYMKLFTPLVKAGLSLMLTTDDGTVGLKGLVTLPLRGELAARAKKGLPTHVYCCGPTRMMQAVGDVCAEFNVPCAASLESVMACGYGVCNGCVARVKDAAATNGFKYVKTCVNGTIFDAATLIWDD